MTVWVTPDTWEHKQEEESECGRRSTRFQIRSAEETKKIAYELFLIWNQCRVKSLPSQSISAAGHNVDVHSA